MDILEMISGPVIGAAIGYLTNYIAVKMLFVPRKPIRLLGRTLPFTPGIIPRRKDALAYAIGRAVEDELLTRDALCEMLLTDQAKNTVALTLTNALTDDSHALAELGAVSGFGRLRGRAEELIADRLCAAVREIDLATPIAREGKALVREKLGALAGMLVTDELMAGIAAAAEERIGEYLVGHKEDIVQAVHAQTQTALAMTPEEAVGALGLSSQELFPVIRDLYEALARRFAPAVAEHISVGDEIEKKIREMSSRSLEALVLSVMKRELRAIVNLGALVGLILGLLNLLF